MVESVPGLVGALVGFVFGWIQYQMIVAVVVGGLRRTNRSKTQAEDSDYKRRIRILQAIMLVLLLFGLPVLGYWVGRSLFG